LPIGQLTDPGRRIRACPGADPPSPASRRSFSFVRLATRASARNRRETVGSLPETGYRRRGMLEPISLGQGRTHCPGLAADERGVVMGRHLALFFPDIARAVGFFRSYSREVN